MSYTIVSSRRGVRNMEVNTNNLTVYEDTNLNELNIKGNLSVTGTSSIQGNTSLQGTLTVGNATTLNDTLTTTGNTTLQGTLTVGGVTALSDKLTVSGNVDCGNLLVNSVYLVPPGTVVSYIKSVAPTGWLLCDGTSYLKTTYPNLASVLGTTFGGNTNYFSVPDLRGRTVIGVGSGSSLSTRTIAEYGGSETHTLSVSEMPSHTHTGTTESSGYHNHGGTTGSAGSEAESETVATGIGAVVAGSGSHTHSISYDGSHTHTFTSDSRGGSSAHNIMQPYLVLGFIIKY